MRVIGCGPATATIAIVGSAPGWAEAKKGLPFVGKTGEQLDHLLGSIGLDRKDLWLTNLYREFLGKDVPHTAADLAVDGPELLAELAAGQFTTVVPLGRDATRFLLGDVDLDSTQGIAWQTEQFGVVVPITHPASAFHSPEASCYVTAGFQALGAYLRGEMTPRLLGDDAHPQPVYEEITHPDQLRWWLRALSPTSVLGVDTEGWVWNPWSVQITTIPGTGFLIPAARPDLLAQLGTRLARTRPHLVFHNSLHDLGVMGALGLPTDLSFSDTMVDAYLLCLEPQGLKAGALRHCGMVMSEYAELVEGPGTKKAQDYLTWLWDWCEDAYDAACQAEFDWQVARGRRIKKLPKLPRSPLHKAVERCLNSRTPRRLWGDQSDDILGAAVRVLGPMPDVTLSDVQPRKVAVDYGCRDSDATLRYSAALAPKLRALNLESVRDLELSTYPLIARMSQVGIKPDLAHFRGLSGRLASEIADVQAALDAATGVEGFNANSGDQVADYLFGRLGLPPGKITDSGRGTTDKKYLKDLEFSYPEHGEIRLIRSFRELTKLKGSFVDVIPSLIQGWPHDGRVHVQFRTTKIPTGRLAATMPDGFPRYNMLAQPKRGKFAKDFRKGWVAEDGHYLAEWDLSQIELRVGAHLSQDPYMLAIYRGEIRNPDGSLIDLHAGLAERIFGVKKRDQTNEQRVSAKEINFGFWMGQTFKGLTASLRSNGVMVNEDDAQRWLDEANQTYKGAQPYKDAMIAHARQHGFVRCLSGRIRYIGGINSPDERVRAEAERFAFSTPVQEGAQWIMKQNEARLYRDILVPYWRQGRWVEPVLQVHDALLLELEADRTLAYDLHRQMVGCMTQAPPGFTIPIETSGDYGDNWAALKSFEEEEERS